MRRRGADLSSPACGEGEMLSLRRRNALAFAGAAVLSVTWLRAALAQQSERLRRIGLFMSLGADDPEDRARIAAFRQALAGLGRIEGRNIQIDIRWRMADSDRLARAAAELVALSPDVIVATGDTIGAVQQATRTIPIVFVLISDPVNAGYVANLNRPGGNTTGFAFVELSIAGKWLELLKQIAPGVTRVGVLYDPASPPAVNQLQAVQAAGGSFAVEVSALGVRDSGEIDAVVSEFAHGSGNCGLVMAPTSLTIIHREQISNLASRLRLPAVYGFPVPSGLASYAPDTIDQYRGAAGYVDRILKGEKPGDLPVQNPTKFDLVVNLKLAKALGLSIPDKLLATADEVIE